jgi:uncharacterized protein YndB with AHSA1/START domain
MPDTREIVTTRVFDAPRDFVFRLWTGQEHIERWWGPNGFRVTTSEMNVRPGGVWRFVMHGPDGTNYHNKIVYDELESPERLVYTHSGGSKFQTIVTFAEKGSKTEITVRLVFGSAAERDDTIKKYNAVEGLNETLERLAQYVTANAQTRR